MRRLQSAFIALVFLLPSGAALAAHSGPEIRQIFDQGVAAYDAGDYEKAFRLWWDLQFEDLAAMRNVAMMLRKGQGTTKDPKRAEEIYTRAAEAGLPTAQADLGEMLLKGEAGPPDARAALPLLAAAAAANHPIAQFELAQMYETGQDGLVPQDLNTARSLYAAAAGHGMKEAADKVKALGPPDLPANLPAQPAVAPQP